MKRLKRILIGLLIADLLGVALYFGLTRLVDATEDVNGGAAIVFYSGNGAEASARIDKALALLEDGQVDRLIMAGGHRPQDGITGSQDMALEAIRRYRYGEAISADVISRDTISAIENAALNADARGADRIVFVTNCMHGLRAQTVYGVVTKNGPSASVACSPSSLNPLRIWSRAHYEAAAWALFVMPESWREGIIDWLRGADEP